MISYDFVKCDFLNWNERDIYIILLMYADSENGRHLQGVYSKHICRKQERKRKRPKTFSYDLLNLKKGKAEGSPIPGHFYGAIMAASWACRACACLSSVAVVQVKNWLRQVSFRE